MDVGIVVPASHWTGCASTPKTILMKNYIILTATVYRKQ